MPWTHGFVAIRDARPESPGWPGEHELRKTEMLLLTLMELGPTHVELDDGPSVI